MSQSIKEVLQVSGSAGCAVHALNATSLAFTALA